MYKYFLIMIGTTQIIMALIEFIFPLRSFLMWRIWVLNRFFPVHGLALIFIGLPLTVYKGYLILNNFFYRAAGGFYRTFYSYLSGKNTKSI